MSDIARCSLCGEPMPAGEEMFKFHGYSGDCPKPPLPKPESDGWAERFRAFMALPEEQRNEVLGPDSPEVKRLKAELATARADYFKRGQESILRKNESGCVCKIGDDETIISACAVHATWRDSARADGRREGMTEAAEICMAESNRLVKKATDSKDSDLYGCANIAAMCAGKIEAAGDATKP